MCADISPESCFVHIVTSYALARPYMVFALLSINLRNRCCEVIISICMFINIWVSPLFYKWVHVFIYCCHSFYMKGSRYQIFILAYIIPSYIEFSCRTIAIASCYFRLSLYFTVTLAGNTGSTLALVLIAISSIESIIFAPANTLISPRFKARL